jgi:hypothetical protein
MNDFVLDIKTRKLSQFPSISNFALDSLQETRILVGK